MLYYTYCLIDYSFVERENMRKPEQKIGSPCLVVSGKTSKPIMAIFRGMDKKTRLANVLVAKDTMRTVPVGHLRDVASNTGVGNAVDYVTGK